MGGLFSPHMNGKQIKSLKAHCAVQYVLCSSREGRGKYFLAVERMFLKSTSASTFSAAAKKGPIN